MYTPWPSARIEAPASNIKTTIQDGIDFTLSSSKKATIALGLKDCFIKNLFINRCHMRFSFQNDIIKIGREHGVGQDRHTLSKQWDEALIFMKYKNFQAQYRKCANNFDCDSASVFTITNNTEVKPIM